MTDGEESYFQKALSNFTMEAASGGAIRHLSDCGYTVSQIAKTLAFPTPLDRIQKTVWEHMVKQGVLLLTEPGSGGAREQVHYVVDYDPYGKRSFRRVSVPCGEPSISAWKERVFTRQEDGSLADFLSERCGKNGEATAYAACDFGLRIRRDPQRFAAALQKLEPLHREYLKGLLWEEQVVYHRLDLRMRQIVGRLYELGEFHGCAYFVALGERVRI